MLFDRGRELPVATVYGAPLRDQLVRWFAARWAWLRPRALPVAVALVGMFVVLNAVNYLAHPPAAAAVAASAPQDPAPAYGFHIKLVLQQ